MHETDLYGPIRDYLVTLGYDVQGEVKGCDIAARKGDDLIDRAQAQFQHQAPDPGHGPPTDHRFGIRSTAGDGQARA